MLPVAVENLEAVSAAACDTRPNYHPLCPKYHGRNGNRYVHCPLFSTAAMSSFQLSTIGPATSSSSREFATVQIEELESPSLLPTVDALDAEFGCEGEAGAAGRRRERGAQMDSTFG